MKPSLKMCGKTGVNGVREDVTWKRPERNRGPLLCGQIYVAEMAAEWIPQEGRETSEAFINPEGCRMNEDVTWIR